MYLNHTDLVLVETAAMGFGDLKTSTGLSALNEYLADKSYIEG